MFPIVVVTALVAIATALLVSRKPWYERQKQYISKIDYPAIAIAKLNRELSRAALERDRHASRLHQQAYVTAALRNDAEAKANRAHVLGVRRSLIAGFVLFGVLGSLAQAVLCYTYLNLSMFPAAILGVSFEFVAAGALTALLHVALGRYRSVELGYNAALKIVAISSIPIALALGILVFSRVAGVELLTVLVSSGAISYSLLVVAEGTPVLCGALGAAVRFAYDDDLRQAWQERLSSRLNGLTMFEEWGREEVVRLSQILASAEKEHPIQVLMYRDQHIDAGPSPGSGKSNGHNIASSGVVIVLAVLVLLHPQLSKAQAVSCSIAIDTSYSVNPEFRQHVGEVILANADILRRCKTLRITAFADLGRNSSSIVLTPISPKPGPDCADPQIESTNALDRALSFIKAYQKKMEEDARQECLHNAETIHQDNLAATASFQEQIRAGFSPLTADTERCTDISGAMAFLAEQRSNVLLIASDFLDDCSWLSRPSRLPFEGTKVVLVPLPTRGDVRDQGYAAYRRALDWASQNPEISVKVVSEITPDYLSGLLK